MIGSDSDFTQISFHEAGLVGLSHVDHTVNLELEGVFVAGVLKAAEVSIEKVTSVVRNELPISHFRMEKRDAEVLTIREENDHVAIAVQWDDYAAKTHEVVAYILNGPNVELRVTFPA